MSSLSVPTPEALCSAAIGKVIIVTGAASGIGFATARLFANSGAQVVLADRDEGLGRQAAEEIGHDCIFIKCDVSSWQEQLHLFTDTYTRYSKIDVVVCNAGIDPEIVLAGSPTDQRVSQAKKEVRSNFLADEIDGTTGLLKHPPSTVMEVNVTGVIYGVKLSAHFMSRTCGGRIVVIGSAASYVPVPDQAIYCASKHAVLGLVRATSKRADMKANNIAISIVAPWMTSTPLTSKIDSRLTRGVPASTGADIGLAVAYLATKPWGEVNGKSIWVQGQNYTEVEDTISECHSKLTRMVST